MRRASERAEQTAKELAALEAWRRSTVVVFTASLLLAAIVVTVAVGSRRGATETTQDLARALITLPIITDGPCRCQGHP